MSRALTRKQREVLLLVANGNTNAAIARWRGVSPHTVAEILTNAYRALGVSDRAQAVAVALKLNEFSLDDIRMPAYDEPSIAEAAADDRAYWNSRYDQA